MRDSDLFGLQGASEPGRSSAPAPATIPSAQATVVVPGHAFDFSFEEIAGDQGMPVVDREVLRPPRPERLRERLSA